MQTKRNLDQFSKHLTKINQLATREATCVFELGRELSIIKQNKLFEDAGFAHWGHFIGSKSLEMIPSKATRYAGIYENLQRLGYKTDECKQLIQEFNTTALSDILPKLDKKVTAKTIAKRLNNAAEYKQIAFSGFDEDGFQVVMEALAKCGMETNENGRRSNTGVALVEMSKKVLESA